jgi:hypothetical protein
LRSDFPAGGHEDIVDLKRIHPVEAVGNFGDGASFTSRSKGPLIFIQQLDANTCQSSLKVVIGPIPDSDAIKL